MIDGYKTYIVAAATILYAVCGAITGYVSYDVAVPLVLGGLATYSIRNAIE